MRYQVVNPDARSARPELARAAWRSEWAVWIAVVAMFATITLAWLVPSLTDTYLGVRLGLGGNAVLLTLEARVGLWLASVVPAAVLTYGLAQLASFFRRVRHGHAFTLTAAAAIARLGWSLLAAALVVPIARAVIVTAIGGAGPGSQVAAHLAPGPAVITLAVLGVAMLAFGKVLREAAALADENASFL